LIHATHWVRVVATVVAALSVTALALKFLPTPFFWIGLMWAVAGFAVLPCFLRIKR